MQVAAAVEQLDLQFAQRGQGAGGQGAVGEDQLPRDAARVEQGQPAQMLEHRALRLGVDFHAPAGVFA